MAFLERRTAMRIKYWVLAGLTSLAMCCLAYTAHANDVIYFPVVEKAERHMTGMFCLTADDTSVAARNYHTMGLGPALALANKDKVTCVLHQSGMSGVIVTGMKLERIEYIDMKRLYLYEATVSGFYFGANRVELKNKIDGSPETVKEYIFMTTPQNPEDEGDPA